MMFTRVLDFWADEYKIDSPFPAGNDIYSGPKTIPIMGLLQCFLLELEQVFGRHPNRQFPPILAMVVGQGVKDVGLMSHCQLCCITTKSIKADMANEVLMVSTFVSLESCQKRATGGC